MGSCTRINYSLLRLDRPRCKPCSRGIWFECVLQCSETVRSAIHDGKNSLKKVALCRWPGIYVEGADWIRICNGSVKALRYSMSCCMSGENGDLHKQNLNRAEGRFLPVALLRFQVRNPTINNREKEQSLYV